MSFPYPIPPGQGPLEVRDAGVKALAIEKGSENVNSRLSGRFFHCADPSGDHTATKMTGHFIPCGLLQHGVQGEPFVSVLLDCRYDLLAVAVTVQPFVNLD